jgi:hypothetical protein
MFRHLLAISCMYVAITCHASDDVQISAAPAEHNYANDFVTFWDATRTLPPNEQIAEFKKTVGARFPEFYGVSRYGGKRSQAEQDKVIANAINSFGPIRQAYIDKVNAFGTDLRRHISSFQAAFPDFKSDTPIYLLHSLGEMDGGTRDLAGKNHLIFGAEQMVRYHGNGNESAFFHHELFHIHHSAQMGQCPEAGVWKSLWSEGLASYVSSVLNPHASDKEMLLDLPSGVVAATRAQMPVALAQLEKVLDSEDGELYGELFTMSGKSRGLPARRGYYLGYLVAAEAGKSRDLSSLAKLNCKEARAVVNSALNQLQAHSK